MAANRFRVVCTVAFGIAVAGCATKPEPVRPAAKNPDTVTQNLNLSGYPPEFRSGFTDGCNAARKSDRSGKPKGDGQYAVGWNDGFDYCKPKK